MRNIFGSALLAAGLTATLTACGGSDDGASSTTSSTTSSTMSSKTASASSSSTSSKLTPTGPTPGATVDAKAWADTSDKALKAEKSYRISEVSTADSGTTTGAMVRGAGDRVDLMAEMPGEGGLRYIDGNAYIQSPELPGKWIKFDKTSTNPEVKDFLEGVRRDVDGDEDINVLAAGKVTFVGDEAEGKHYKAQAPADRFYEDEVDEDSETDQGGPVDRTADKAKLKGRTVDIDVWLDAKNRPVKVKTDSTGLSGLGLSAKTSDVVFVSTTTYSGWGESVKIEVPPAAATVSADALSGQGQA